ncbi:MAG: arsenate reductase ArsC [Chloroflexi bacterium]|nr:arsenate reductase ArsC [Chloroflexota bacterium]
MTSTARHILVLCTGNSARSQMAEGWFRHLGGRTVTVASAGTAPRPSVHPLAIEAMREVGIDISGHRPKLVQDVMETPHDYVVTVCDHARDTCPVLPGTHQSLHWGFDDPASDETDTAMLTFRRIRDQIADAIRTWLAEGQSPAH